MLQVTIDKLFHQLKTSTQKSYHKNHIFENKKNNDHTTNKKCVLLRTKLRSAVLLQVEALERNQWNKDSGFFRVGKEKRTSFHVLISLSRLSSYILAK